MKKKSFKTVAAMLTMVLSLNGFGVFGTYADDNTTSIPDAVEYDPGDVNFDNVIDAEDALEVLKHAAKLEELGQYNYIRADVDLSNIVDAQDALYILQYAAHLISSFDEVKVHPAPLEPTDEPTPVPTKAPTGHEIYDSINVECDYYNSFVVELEAAENKIFTTADFPELDLKDVWTNGKLKTEIGYLYELVMVLDADNCTDDVLNEAMNKVKEMEFVSDVSYNKYVDRDTILELNHSEYILEVGESIDLSIADYRPYDDSTNTTCIIVDFNTDTIGGEAISLETLEKYGVGKLTAGLYVMTGATGTWPNNLDSDYYITVAAGCGYLPVVHLLSQLPEVDMVQCIRTTFPTGNRFYENWACSDEEVAEMVLSGGEDINENASVTKLNQTATITGLKAGEVTISVTKGGWGNKEGTGTCVIKVVEPDSAVYEVEYPHLASYVHELEDRNLYHEWNDSRNEQTRAYRSKYDGTLDDFFKTSIKNVLSKETDENVVLSPISLYMAMSMVAETVDGEGRNEILNLMGVDSIENLRDQANAVWNAHYCDDGTIVSLLGNSLWLRDDIEYKNSLLKTLSENYYASSYRGEMGSNAFNDSLRNWLNEQTGGKLKEQADGVELNEDTLMGLYSTIYFRGKWSGEFGVTKQDEPFYSPSGEIMCQYLTSEKSWRDYYWADKFAAINSEITYGGKMWFILPDEGVNPEEVIASEDFMELILEEDKWENKRDDILVNLRIPKFDVKSDLDLKSDLKSLGINEIFSADADFSPIIGDEGAIFISDIKQQARVAIDEKGVEATAFTEVIYAGSPMPPENEVDFIANRPFIFVIESTVGTPLFVGIVNNP